MAVGRGLAAGDPERDPPDLSALLRLAARGDADAEKALYEAVYAELHRLAAVWMSRQRRGHTLQATALVHEAFLKIARSPSEFEGRTHFLATAARAMRSILVDHARTRGREKRGGGRARVPLDAVLLSYEDRADDILALDEALKELAEVDAQAALVVELKFFGGLRTEEIAARLGVSGRTVERDWETARTWLAEQLAP